MNGSVAVGSLSVLNGSLDLTGNDSAGQFTGSGTLGVNGTLTSSSATPYEFDGALSGSGLILKSGVGMLTLTNSGSTFDGTVRIGAGTLLLTNARSCKTRPWT